MHSHFSRIKFWMLAFAVALLASACSHNTSTTTTPAAETLSGNVRRPICSVFQPLQYEDVTGR
jgi:hypothetical protein